MDSVLRIKMLTASQLQNRHTEIKQSQVMFVNITWLLLFSEGFYETPSGLSLAIWATMASINKQHLLCAMFNMHYLSQFSTYKRPCFISFQGWQKSGEPLYHKVTTRECQTSNLGPSLKAVIPNTVHWNRKTQTINLTRTYPRHGGYHLLTQDGRLSQFGSGICTNKLTKNIGRWIIFEYVGSHH